MKILIVEQSQDLAREFSYLLISYGVQGITVCNRLAALELLKTQDDIKLGIIDVDNNEVEGLQLIEDIYIKEENGFRFIIHTVSLKDNLPEQLNNKNIIGIIQKPFEYGRVEAALKIIFSSINFPDIDKRTHIRITPDKNDLLRISFKIKGYSHLICGKIVNLSLGGVAVELLNPVDIDQLEQGTMIPILEFALNCRLITVGGMISVKRGKLIAIRFGALNRDTRNSLAKYIFKRIT